MAAVFVKETQGKASEVPVQVLFPDAGVRLIIIQFIQLLKITITTCYFVKSKCK